MWRLLCWEPRAQGRILSYRDTYGRFSAVEQLLDVEGIGPTLLEQLRGLVTVDQTEG